jgi:hypothetical protein
MTDRLPGIFALVLVVSPLATIGVIALDAHARRASSRWVDPALVRVASRLPTGDLALSGGARWLRTPSLEEPGAAFADGPATADPDPAGGIMAPPIDLWTRTESRTEAR